MNGDLFRMREVSRERECPRDIEKRVERMEMFLGFIGLLVMILGVILSNK